jgi:hypothetical protein
MGAVALGDPREQVVEGADRPAHERSCALE